MSKYGYVRVLTKGQNVDSQMLDIEKLSIPKDNIYIDKLTGEKYNWPQYRKLLKKLRAGDELYIKSIDKLGFDSDEISEQWQQLTKVKEVEIIVLDFPLLDTRKHMDKTDDMIVADIVPQILSYMTQTEKENNLQRQLAGIQAAKIKGVKFGRPKSVAPDNFGEVISRWEKKEISLREAARQLNTNHVTLSRWIRDSK